MRRESRWRTTTELGPSPRWPPDNDLITENGTVGEERTVVALRSGLMLRAVDLAGSKDHDPGVRLSTCMGLTSGSSSGHLPQHYPSLPSTGC